jgi:hypothetical protein
MNFAESSMRSTDRHRAPTNLAGPARITTAIDGPCVDGWF